VDRNVPTLVSSMTADELAAGQFHMCARTGGNVWCWGDNNYGAVGNGSVGPDVLRATQVEGIDDAIELAAGGAVSCALRANGQLLCWGGAPLGDSSRQSSATPTVVSLSCP
jgi:alpha-tubulin suppressor-like RCC1 family protein